MKEFVTKFDMEAAFKALDEIDVPKVKGGIRANRVNMCETFSKKQKMDALMEEYYDITSNEELEEAHNDREADIAKAKLARIEKIVDLNAESEDDIMPSYVGKFIIQCPQCMTMFYKNEDDVEKSEDDEGVCNIGEECQHCGNTSGYNIVGKVARVGEEEADNYDAEDFDDADTASTAEESDEAEENTDDETTEEETEGEDTSEESDEEDTDKESEDDGEESEDELSELSLDDLDLDLEDEEDKKEESLHKSVNDTKHESENKSENLTLNEAHEANDVDYSDSFIKDGCYWLAKEGEFDTMRDTKAAYEQAEQIIAYMPTYEKKHKGKNVVAGKKLKVVKGEDGYKVIVDESLTEQEVQKEPSKAVDPETGKVFHIMPKFKDEALATIVDEDTGEKTKMYWSDLYDCYDIYDINDTAISMRDDRFSSYESFNKSKYNSEFSSVNNTEHKSLNEDDNDEFVEISVPVDENGDPKPFSLLSEDVIESSGNITIPEDYFTDETDEISDEEAIKAANNFSQTIENTKMSLESLHESSPEGAEEITAKQKVEGEKTEVFTELPNYDVEVEQKGEKIEIELMPKDVNDAEVEQSENETTDFDIDGLDEVDETAIEDEFTESLRETYENVKDFKMTGCSIADGKLHINGLINFKSGKSKKTTYTFSEAINNKKLGVCLTGVNKDIILDEEAQLHLLCNVKNKKLIAEKFVYRYSDGNTLVEGLKKRKN